LRTLENGLRRYPEESPVVRARALLYRAELAIRLGNAELARASVSEAKSLALSAEQRTELAADLDHALELLEEQSGS